MRRWSTLLAAVVVAAGCSIPPQHDLDAVTSPSTSQVAPADVARARAELAALTVSPGTNGTGYDRTRGFGRSWSLDSDHDGCNQRQDVLRRDLTDVVMADRCTVVSGTLDDPYTGVVVHFVRTSPSAVQVDHVAPLRWAWAHGAAGWPRSRRVELANDLSELVATTAVANDVKGDSGPGRWMPQQSYRCTYAARYIDVASRYGLSVTAADRVALAAALEGCP